MQVVGVGFIISSRIPWRPARTWRRPPNIMLAQAGRQLPAFMYSKKERQQLGIEA